MLTNATIEKAVSVLGYELRERLGAGGYGEVWGVTAPGGLPKAIKILFGTSDERRAQTELKSLHRIRQIRHPFLLSLERIDVIENQVVIVTELADSSLADLFEECVNNGLPGIPRKELIEYMRQAAEVLDYLYNDHSLQHLDVKPENLMLVGKHVKLGDFGLVKDLRDCSESLVGGLTPNYSAPEIFDGAPKPTSDQYSLAIVYQEMLTGTRPFSGVTPAQLAAQHLHEAPDVSPLPKSDQPVVAKALSKSAERRFRTCSEFIQQLHDVELLPKKRSRSTVLARCMSDTVQNRLADKMGNVPSTKGGTTTKSVNVPAPRELEWQHAATSLPSPPEFSPTLIVGLGRTGADIVRLLKTKLQQQVGELSKLPAISFAAIDTDHTTISECSFDSHGLVSLAPRELIHVPLRKPEAYRNRNAIHAHWLHRRWIFNVPKSLQTEGLRPLGRLAIADHFESLCTRLMPHLESLTTAEGVACTAEALGMSPGDNQPRVVLVGAISGGFASGALLDCSYLVKAMFAELGLNQHHVHGILLHAQKQPNRQGDLNVANTLAFLTELRHYTQAGYVGDQSTGIPEMPEVCPLDQAYLVQLGVDIEEDRWQEQLNSVADFVRLSHFSAAEPYFRRRRQIDEQSDYFALKSFGVQYLYRLSHERFADLAEHLIYQLMKQWVQGNDAQVVAVDAVQAFESFLDVERWMNAIGSRVFPTGSFTQWRKVLLTSIDPSRTSPDNIPLQIEQLLEFLLRADTVEQSSMDLEIGSRSDEFIAANVKIFGAQLLDWIQAELNRPRLNLARILNTLRAIQTRIEQSIATQRDLANELNSQLGKVHAQRIADDRQFRINRRQFDWQALVDVLIQTKQQLSAGHILVRLLKRFSGLVDQMREQLFQLQNHLELIFQPGTKSSQQCSPTTGTGSAGDDPLAQAAWARLAAQAPELVENSLQRIYRRFIQPAGGYGTVLYSLDTYQKQFIHEVHVAINQELFAACQALNCDQLVATNLSPSKWQELLAEAAENAQPHVDTCRARTRLMIAGPDECLAKYTVQALTQQLPAQPAFFPTSTGELFIVADADEIQIADVAFEMINNYPTTLDMSQRILTRNDIQWEPLGDLF